MQALVYFITHSTGRYCSDLILRIAGDLAAAIQGRMQAQLMLSCDNEAVYVSVARREAGTFSHSWKRGSAATG